MNCRLLLIFALIGSILGSCANPNGVGKKQVDEDDLVARLSAELVSNPTAQSDIEKNALINFAIDNNIDARFTPSGILAYHEKIGDGDSPGLNDEVVAHYRGSLLDGKEFDSSYGRNQPLKFNLRQMIKGWQEVVPHMKTGGKSTFLIPSQLAYGNKGFPGLIPANSPLKFEIELISVNKREN